MDAMDGFKLIHEVRMIDLDLPIFVLTGFGKSLDSKILKSFKNIDIFIKPFSTEYIVKRVFDKIRP